MKKIFLFSIYCLLFTVCSSYAQVPADSLPGTYAGQYWYANPATSPWTITQDTAYVTNTDSVNCVVKVHDLINFSITGTPPAATYYTDYYSCNGAAPSNYYSKFYFGDSIRIIFDNIPQPPPNPSYSMRFYGKRISHLTGIKANISSGLVISIYPNPCSDKLNIECEMLNEEMQIIINDITGREIKNEKLQINKTSEVMVSNLKEGVYFVRIQAAACTFNKKVVIQR